MHLFVQIDPSSVYNYSVIKKIKINIISVFTLSNHMLINSCMESWKNRTISAFFQRWYHHQLLVSKYKLSDLFGQRKTCLSVFYCTFSIFFKVKRVKKIVEIFEPFKRFQQLFMQTKHNFFQKYILCYFVFNKKPILFSLK